MLPKKYGNLIVSVALSLSSTLVFPQDDSGDGNIEITKITEKIYKLNVNQFVNMVAYVGSDGVLLVDTARI